MRHPPPPLVSRSATWFGSVRISRRLSFTLLILTIPPPPPSYWPSRNAFSPSILYGIPKSPPSGLASTTLLSPPPLPNPFHSFPQSLLYGTPELSLLGLDTHTPAYSTPTYPLPLPLPPPPTPLPPYRLAH